MTAALARHDLADPLASLASRNTLDQLPEVPRKLVDRLTFATPNDDAQHN